MARKLWWAWLSLLDTVGAVLLVRAGAPYVADRIAWARFRDRLTPEQIVAVSVDRLERQLPDDLRLAFLEKLAAAKSLEFTPRSVDPEAHFLLQSTALGEFLREHAPVSTGQ
jgi:hypothetical protein